MAFVLPAHAQVVINTTANMNFGRIDFAAAHNGRIQLGTDGNVQISGFGLSARNDGNAAAAQVTLPNSGILELKCEDVARMRGSGATPNAIDIVNIEIAVNTGVAFGSGIACQGTRNPDPVTLTLDMDALNDPTVLFGGEIEFISPTTLPPSKLYTSTAGGGQPIQLSIVVQ